MMACEGIQPKKEGGSYQCIQIFEGRALRGQSQAQSSGAL